MIAELEDSFAQVGGSLLVSVKGIPIVIGKDIMFMPDSELNTGYFGSTTNIGLGFGLPGGEFHVEWGETATWKSTQFNIFDVAKVAYDKTMEWQR